MSLCVCPHVGIDGMYDPKHRQQVARFLNQLEPTGLYGRARWSLLSIAEQYERGVDISDIPYRGGACSRTHKCCGVCTRRCGTRCIQDCLHRLYVWSLLVENTPVESRDHIPLAIRLIVDQRFDSHEQLSWCVGEIISAHTNRELSQHMKKAELKWYEHPYYNDYGPMVVLDPETGRRKVNPVTGEVVYRNWPETGLCPHCLPKVLVDSRRTERKSIR